MKRLMKKAMLAVLVIAAAATIQTDRKSVV